jgi:DNA repair exonuclease SbcCD nuclease subunit
MTVRIRVLSDLHLECGPFNYTPVDEDLVVLAGDIADQSCPAKRHRRALCEAIASAGVPTVYVLGNHEFYRDNSPFRLIARRLRKDLPAGITLLDRGVLGAIRILGCTLWSDCGGNHLAQLAAERSINDFHWMRDDHGDPITATTMAGWHLLERRWLSQQIDQADRPVVVVTHWQPTAASTPERFRNGELTPYFQTACADLLRPPVRLWIHGHTHDSVDLVERGVRIICNPRGYVDEINKQFDENMVVSVEAP